MHVKRLLQIQSATLIQSYLRRRLALNLAIQLKHIRKEKAKLSVALQLQCHFRRRKAQLLYQQLLKTAKSLIIQRRLRQYLALQRVRNLLKRRCSVVFIQRFYKRRLRSKHQKALVVQKHLRKIIVQRKVQKLISMQKGAIKLKQAIERMVKFKAVQVFKLNNVVIKLQCLIRRKQCMKRYKILLKEAATKTMRSLFTKSIFLQLKAFSTYFSQLMQQKTLIIQKQLRRFIAIKRTKSLLSLKLKHSNAKFIQKHLRGLLARSLVEYKLLQKAAILKIQGLARIIVAKRKLRLLRAQAVKSEQRKQKDLEKKFEKTKRVEKNIENYIESLFHREIQQQKEMRKNLAMTPMSQRKSQLKSDSQRQLFTSQTNVRSDKNEAIVLPNIVGALEQKGEDSIKHADERTGSSEVNEILASSAVMDDDNGSTSQGQDRQQKALRIRKSKNGGVTLNNVVVNKGSKGTQQRELIQKMSNTLAKVKATSNQQSQRVAHHSHSTVNKGPKPKTFAESLMNMLAMQNIGQAFSENPVEALSILQDEGDRRRNSNSSASKNNASFVSNGHKKHQPIPSTYQLEGGESKNLENHVHFPRLNEFKSATNNIYLAQRPVQDPRKESEFQLQILESKINQSDQLNRSNNLAHSQTDLQTVDPQQRRSTESLRRMNSGGQPKYAEYMQDSLQPRPKELTHMMVVQAYKKAHVPQHQDHFRKQKKRGESLGPLITSKKQNPINAMGSFKKNDKLMQGILETTNKLIII